MNKARARTVVTGTGMPAERTGGEHETPCQSGPAYACCVWQSHPSLRRKWPGVGLS